MTSPNVPYSKFACLLIWLCIVIASLLHFATNGVADVISWDVYGYYLYLPAILKYGDIVEYKFAFDHLEQYPIAANLFQIYELPNGRMGPIYTGGMAILYLPFYLLADLFAHLTSYKADALSAPYQIGIILAAWSYAALGLRYARKFLMAVGVNDLIIAIVLIIVCLGTNYFHYSAINCGMPHAILYSLYTMLLYYTYRWHQNPNTRDTAFIAVIIALLSIARPSEVISLFIPLFYGVYSIPTLKSKIKLVGEHFAQVLLLALIGFSIVGLQVLFWKIGVDHYIFNGYTSGSFDFDSPHFMEGLFSYRAGWLLYTPVMVLFLMGLFLLPKKFPKWTLGIWFFFFLNIYVVFSWYMWWYASSFGMRALVQSYALLLLPGCALLGSVWQWPYLRNAIISVAVLLIGLNQFQHWQYNNRIIMYDGMNQTYYWEVFGSTKQDRTLWKYLDSDEKRPVHLSLVDARECLNKKFPENKLSPSKPFNGKISVKISEENISHYSKKWLRVGSHLKYVGNDFYMHETAKLVCSVNRNGKNIKWTGVRVQRIINENEWTWTDFDFEIPDLEIGDELSILLWNAGPDILYLKELEGCVYK